MLWAVCYGPCAVGRVLCRPLVDGHSRGGDGAEALLSGRVPDLQLHLLTVDLHRPDLKVHADGGDVATYSHTHTTTHTHKTTHKCILLSNPSSFPQGFPYLYCLCDRHGLWKKKSLSRVCVCVCVCVYMSYLKMCCLRIVTEGCSCPPPPRTK